MNHTDTLSVAATAARRLLTRLRDLDTVVRQFHDDPLGELIVLRDAITDLHRLAADIDTALTPRPGDRIYVTHLPWYGPEGTDVLLTIWADGQLEVALRPGHSHTRVTWSPPATLAPPDAPT